MATLSRPIKAFLKSHQLTEQDITVLSEGSEIRIGVSEEVLERLKSMPDSFIVTTAGKTRVVFPKPSFVFSQT